MPIFTPPELRHRSSALGAPPAKGRGSRRVPFESWGCYPRYDATVVPLTWQADFLKVLEQYNGMPTGALAVGMGRSGGDSCLLRDGNLLVTAGMNRLLAFDPGQGILTAEAGLTLADLLEFSVPRGWFLPVSPSTKSVTLGGAVANDIHGKNHQRAGTFGNHVTQFELVRSDGERIHCSATDNPDWFAATIGGLGLTGVITWVQLRLKPICSRLIDCERVQFRGIDELLALTEQFRHVEYTVSLVDSTGTGGNLARGIFILGDHSRIPDELLPSAAPQLAIPLDAPASLLNRVSVRFISTVFFHKQRRPRIRTLQDYEPFFYPLDRVRHWNRIYGKSGLLQFQSVLPWAAAREGTAALLNEVAKSGLASFPAVLKTFGDVSSPGLMSFPQPGLTLALDFPIRGERTFALFDRLASMTFDFGGRLYPARDARMPASQFQASYPQWQQFARFKDPLLTSSFWERVTQ